MTDVILINAPWKKDFNRCGRWGGRTISLSKNPPIYFLYVGAILKQQGYTVEILDALAEGLSLEEVKRRVYKTNPNLVVIESNCASITSDLECAKAIKGIIKNNSFVGLSGMMATSFHKTLMEENTFLDFCLIGEYDFTIPKILKFGLDVGDVAFRKSYGLEHGVYFGEKMNYIENLDSLPYPDYSLINPKLYDEIIIQKRPFRQSVESRACPFSCSMCISHIMFGKKWRAMSPKRIVDEMEYWEDKGIKEVFWDGETFTISKERCLEICKLIKDRELKISWSCLSRADTVTPEMLKVMSETNCVLIRYGFESATQEILDFIHKGYKLEDVTNASKWTRDVGILIHGAWMFVPPVETKKTAIDTIELAKETSDTAQFTICTPYFGTDYYNLCKEKGWLLTEDWSEYLASDKSVVKSDIDLGEFVERGYKEFYTRPSYMIKSIYREMRKGTFRKALKVGSRIIGVKRYW